MGPLDTYRFIWQAAIPAATPALPPNAPHVLLAVDQLGETLGGGERVVLRLAALLPSYGFRVSILTLSLHPQSPALSGPSPCPIYVLPLHRTWDPRSFRAALELRRFLRDQHVRLVQTFFESSDLWAGCVAKTVRGVKLVWSRRDLGILRAGKHKAAYRLLRRLPDHVFAVSEEVRRFCLEVDGIAPERCTTVYNGVDLDPQDVVQPPQAHNQPLRVLAVGNIRRVKGHDVLLEAAAIVCRGLPEAEFAIAGEPVEADYFAELQRHAAELGLSERFHFLGGVRDLASEFHRASVFAMPSRSEGFSNAVIEAMAASLPVVATAVGGNLEAVDDGVTGTLVPPDAPGVLAQALLDLLLDPPRAEGMGRAGRERASRLFTTQGMMVATTSVYHQLLSR